MARRVFFSFDYDHDVWRASQIRNSNMTNDHRGFIDAADWESIERQGDEAIKYWINDQLENTTVTVVLIGAKTDKSEWVRYEIEQSAEKGNGIFGIRIHKMKDRNGQTDLRGSADFGTICTEDEDCGEFEELFDTYDWKDDDGYENFESWIESAARDAGL